MHKDRIKQAFHTGNSTNASDTAVQLNSAPYAVVPTRELGTHERHPDFLTTLTLNKKVSQPSIPCGVFWNSKLQEVLLWVQEVCSFSG